jgi:uncharacterized ion transporter superfamily protein YfcC
MTFVYTALGAFMGFESSIGLIPIAALLSLAIGGDLVLAAGISVAAVAVGFGLSPVNIYTVGTGHRLAELPLFSGAGLRTVLCLSAAALLAAYNVRYFRRIRRDPQASLSGGLDAEGLALSKSIADYRMSTKDFVVVAITLAGLGVKLWGVFRSTPTGARNRSRCRSAWPRPSSACCCWRSPAASPPCCWRPA